MGLVFFIDPEHIPPYKSIHTDTYSKFERLSSSILSISSVVHWLRERRKKDREGGKKKDKQGPRKARREGGGKARKENILFK